MDLGIAGRVAVVAASSKGLGRATAEALAAEGCRVVLNSRDPGRLAEVTSSLPETIGVAGDITDPAVPGRLVEAALSRWGQVDIVVGNAGGPPAASTFEITDDQVHAAVEANLLASVRLARAALPSMRERGWGRICFITSATVRQPSRDLVLSNVARTGLWSWAKTAAQEVAEEGITVNLACPGSHLTDRLLETRSEHDRAGDPADFGKVVAFLCSKPAKFVSGIAMGVDGGTVTGLL